MSNNNIPSAALGDLFVDAAREVIERGRIKAQMEKLLRIIEADKSRLHNAYAEIGKMHCEGTLGKNKAKTEMVYNTIAHLKSRLEKAKIRMDQLQQAHSVDECTVAFRDELNSKVQQAKEASVAAAKDFGAKARIAAEDFPDTFEQIKGKAAVAADKAKAAVGEVANKASAVVAKMGKKQSGDSECTDTCNEDSYVDILADMDDEYDYEDDSYIEEYTEEDQAAAADISAILGSIGFTLKEVDEIDHSAPDTAPEATAEETASETESPETEVPTDGESPESFDF